jgi:hypothetical protein
MNDQTEILDATDGEVVDAEVSQSDLVNISIEKVRGEVTAFNKIEAGIAKIAKAHPSNLVLDVTTPAGMKMAVTARAAWRDPRVALERARKSAKAPVLKLGRDIDAYAASIEERLRIGESNYHDQIKVEEERKAREKKAAEEAEAARVQQIQGRIAFLFSTRPGRVFGKPAEAIHAALVDVQQQEIAEAVFAELTQAAIDAKELAEASLTDMYRKQRDHEAEIIAQRTQAEENERRRAELAKQQADFEESQRAHREQVARELAERQAKEEAERAARKAEQDKIDADRAALARERQAEEDRKAAAERQRLDDEAAERRERQADLQAIKGLYGDYSANEDTVAAGLAKLDLVPMSAPLWGDLLEEAQAAVAEQRTALTKRLAFLDEQKAILAAAQKAEAAAKRKAKKADTLAKIAPRMLAALKGVVRVADRETDEFIEARAVIAEVEAE